jgi:hypothetical protein
MSSEIVQSNVSDTMQRPIVAVMIDEELNALGARCSLAVARLNWGARNGLSDLIESTVGHVD